MDEVTRVLARCRLCVHLSADEMRTLTGRGVVRGVGLEHGRERVV